MDTDKLIKLLTFTTRGTLEMCGWRPDRLVDTSDYVRALCAKGLRTDDKAIDFLSTFGGLVLSVPHPYVPSDIMDVSFDVIHAADCGVPHLQWWSGFQRVTGIQLTVIGTSNSGQELLSLDCEGAMYANAETDFARIGYDIANSLNALCEARPLPERIEYDKAIAYGWG